MINYHAIMFGLEFLNFFIIAVSKFFTLFIRPYFAEVMFVLQVHAYHQQRVHVVFNKCGL